MSGLGTGHDNKGVRGELRIKGKIPTLAQPARMGHPQKESKDKIKSLTHPPKDAAALLTANRYEVKSLAEVLVLRKVEGLSGLEFHGVWVGLESKAGRAEARPYISMRGILSEASANHNLPFER